MKLEPLWDGLREQHVSSTCGGSWRVSDLIEATKHLPVIEIPLDYLNFDANKFSNENIYQFAQHAKKCFDADLKYPIIIDHMGGILDGRHRMVKALILGKKTIKAKKMQNYITPTVRP